MLSVSIIEEIDRLLQEGEWTQTSIAERLGVSRGTVNAIARGRRALFGRYHDDDGAPDQHDLLYGRRSERCAVCGYRVYVPCRICQTRAYAERRRPLQIAASLGPGRSVLPALTSVSERDQPSAPRHSPEIPHPAAD